MTMLLGGESLIGQHDLPLLLATQPQPLRHAHSLLPAAARILKEQERDLRGTVLLLFQPAEEGLAGGKFVVESGALEGVAAIHGLHVWPTLKSGMFTSKVHHKRPTLARESRSILALYLLCHQWKAVPERERHSTPPFTCMSLAGRHHHGGVHKLRVHP